MDELLPFRWSSTFAVRMKITRIMCDQCFFFCSVSSITGCCRVSGMHLQEIIVPEVVDFRNQAELACGYAMTGADLQSVKWYKDSMEFFR